jgi:hypothetical protein
VDHKKNYNTIQELLDNDGNKVRGFMKLARMGVNHFKEFFKDSKQENIGEMLKMLGNFLRLIEGEESNDLFRPMSIEELLKVINCFQNAKIPGLESWTKKFFVEFFKVVDGNFL